MRQCRSQPALAHLAAPASANRDRGREPPQAAGCRRPAPDRLPSPRRPQSPTCRRRRFRRPCGTRRARRTALLISSRSAARASTRPIMIRPGSTPRSDRATRWRCRRPRPTASTRSRPTSRWAMSAAAPIDWHVVDKDLDAARRTRCSARAGDAQHPPGARRAASDPSAICALKAALESTPHHRDGQDQPDPAEHGPLALAAARPRQKYIIVNVPAFHATLVENGVTRWKQRAIAGAIKTPTPQLSAMATGVILNPWWEVPQSIDSEVAGKPGYVAVKGKDGKVQRWRQPPGPTNALGQMKFVMYNPQNIYPARHQCAQPVQQPDARAQPRLRPHREHPRPGDRAARRRRRRMDPREDRRGARHARRRVRPSS